MTFNRLLSCLSLPLYNKAHKINLHLQNLELQWNLLVAAGIHLYLGVMRNDAKETIWVKVIVAPDPYTAALTFMNEALLPSQNICLAVNNNHLKEGLQNSLLSP